MKHFIIKGPTKGVKGNINISGAKNSCLPLMAASILFEKKVVFKNIPLVNEMNIPSDIIESKKLCIIGLITEAERLFDIRRNRLNSLKEKEASDYTNLEKIRSEVDRSKSIFKKNKWPVIDVTRKSVEETAASIIKIFEIKNKND